jgi:regulator of sigma E protease
MLAILSPILVFGLVIFVHELGHFIAAKAVGVYAPRFSIGFGPSLFRKRWGETEYVLAVLPLGGYVRMASRLDEDTAFLEGGGETAPRSESPDFDPNAMIPFGPLPIPEHRLFESKPLPARLLILIAGVTMNVLLTFFILVGR